MIPSKSSAVALAVGLAATGLTVTTELAGAFVYTCSSGGGAGRRPRGAFVRRRESQTSCLIRSGGGNRYDNEDDDQGRARWSIRCRAPTKMGLLRRGRRGTERVSMSPMADDSDSDKGNHSVEEANEVDGQGEREGEVYDALAEVEQGVALATEAAVEAVKSAAEEAESSRQTYTAAALRGLKRARVALEEALDELGRSTVDELGLAPPAYMDLHFPFPLTSDSSDDNEASAGDGVEGEGRGRDKREKERAGWLRQWQKKGVVPTTEVMSEVLEENFEALDDRVERARASVETALNELGLAVPSEPRDREGISGDDNGAEFEGGIPASEIKSATAAATVAAAEAAASGGGQRWWLPERLRARLEELDAATDTAAALGLQEGVNGTSSGGSVEAASGSSQSDIGKFFRRSPLSSIQSLPSSIQSQGNVAKRAVKRAKNALGTAIDDLGLTRPTVGSALERFLNADEVVGLWRQEEELEDQLPNGDDVLPGTDIGAPERRIWVVTTAALPWMTGTSVNPLLRAAYLSRGREPGKVSLMVPWLSPEDQPFVLPEGKRFDTREEQGAFVRDWLRKAGMEAEADDLRIFWYDARYHQLAGSIFPMGDLTRLIPDDEADVCILEEPEHLNWFRATGVNWSKKFTHVVGVIHTNYVHYTTADTSHWASGKVKAPFARAFNKIMARAYCDKVIKLSATLQRFAQEKETVANVHGVRENFLIVGDERKQAAASGEPFPEETRPYFLGKMLWEKGYDRLWDLLKGFQDAEALADEEERFTAEGVDSGGGGEFGLNAYGSGPDSEAIREKAQDMGLAVKFHPATDHAELSQYKTFVNPSESEVLCTTVAEALAMGKFAIIAEHPSNEFFYQFPNALRFKNQEEFNRQLKFSIENQPTPLTPEKRHVLGWEAATDRLVESAKVTVKEARRRRRELDEAAWLFHYYLGSGRRGDRVRKIMAAGVAAEQNAHMDMVLKAEEEAQNEAEGSTNPVSSTSDKSAAEKVSSES